MNPVIIIGIIVLVCCLISSSIGGYFIMNASPEPEPEAGAEAGAEAEAGGSSNGDGETVVRGCTNSAATNYSPTATEDDGSCAIPGCTTSAATNYSPTATEDDGSCRYTKIDLPVFNYGPCAGRTITDLEIYPADLSIWDPPGGAASALAGSSGLQGWGDFTAQTFIDDYNNGTQQSFFINSTTSVGQDCDRLNSPLVIIKRNMIDDPSKSHFGMFNFDENTPIPKFKADSKDFIMIKGR